jgi:hypothetical protein
MEVLWIIAPGLARGRVAFKIKFPPNLSKGGFGKVKFSEVFTPGRESLSRL